MTKNLSQSPKSADSAKKPKPSQTESEPIEPHELAGKMTPEQMRELVNRLMASKTPKP